MQARVTVRLAAPLAAAHQMHNALMQMPATARKPAFQGHAHQDLLLLAMILMHARQTAAIQPLAAFSLL